MPPKKRAANTRALAAAKKARLEAEEEAEAAAAAAAPTLLASLASLTDSVERRKQQISQSSSSSQSQSQSLSYEEVDSSKDVIKHLTELLRLGAPAKNNNNNTTSSNSKNNNNNKNNSKKIGRDIIRCVKDIFSIEDGKEDEESEDEDEVLANGIVLVGGSSVKERDIKCQVSQTVMTNPVKNVHPTTSCIHRFERNSIVALLKSKPHVSCPNSGCNGKWHMAYMSEDKEFAAKIREFVAKQKRAKQSPKNIIEIF